MYSTVLYLAFVPTFSDTPVSRCMLRIVSYLFVSHQQANSIEKGSCASAAMNIHYEDHEDYGMYIVYTRDVAVEAISKQLPVPQYSMLQGGKSESSGSYLAK